MILLILMSPINSCQESSHYELNTDFECISEYMQINLMRLRKDGYYEEFDKSMRSVLKIRSFIEDDYIYELMYASPSMKYGIK